MNLIVSVYQMKESKHNNTKSIFSLAGGIWLGNYC